MTLHASYHHLHWAGHPHLAQRFADAVHAYAVHAYADHGLETPSAPNHEPDLHHHGDADLAEGLVDLAVNVRVRTPPDWLLAVLAETLPDLARYPRSQTAREAIASAHDVPLDQVLPLAGGAEGFTLLARALRPRRSVVVYPQFTEPEAALMAAGHAPVRVVLAADRGFVLDPDQVPADADLVMIGNPTNPTSVLHPAALLRHLVRPGRVLVVDEAFLDAVPGEPESLIGADSSGVVVLRSLTKTWGLAGLRAGYAVGDREIIEAMRAQQPPWSVSTPALAATVACLSPKARELADEAARIGDRERSILVELLTELGLPPVPAARGPFVLVDTTPLRGSRPAGHVRLRLREQGFAVRRGDTFPGLGPDWVRIAVRDTATSSRLAAALAPIAADGQGAPQAGR